MGLEIEIWEEKRGKEETSGNINIQREDEKGLRVIVESSEKFQRSSISRVSDAIERMMTAIRSF